jgi:hypothetical protein
MTKSVEVNREELHDILDRVVENRFQFDVSLPGGMNAINKCIWCDKSVYRYESVDEIEHQEWCPYLKAVEMRNSIS